MTAYLCIFGGLLAVCGDVVCKRWADGGAPWVLVAGCGIYAVDACVWAAILRRGILLSVGAVAWSATSLLMGFLAGVVVYGERPQPRKCAGALFALLGVLMVGGCTRSSEVKAEEKIAVQEEAKARSTEQSTETVQTGPGEETILKFALPQAPIDAENHEQWGDDNAADSPLSASVGHPPVQSGAGKVKKAHGEMHDDGLPPHGPLVEADIIKTGSVLDTKTASTQTAVDTSLAEKQEKASDTKKKTSFALPWWVWALGAVGVALGIAIARKTLLGKAVAAAEAAAKEVL